MTLIGQSLVLESESTDVVTESSTKSNQHTIVSNVRIGNYTAIVDRANRFVLTCAVYLVQCNDIMEIVFMHFAL
jgi:hypothetical protein